MREILCKTFLFMPPVERGGGSTEGRLTSTSRIDQTPPPPPNFEDYLNQMHSDIKSNYNAPAVKGNYTAADDAPKE